MESPNPPRLFMTRRVGRLLGAALLALFACATTVDAAQFTLTWADNSTNESGFRIERSTNGTTYTEIATVGANVVSYVDSGLPNATTYWYRIRAYNSSGNSSYSNVATGTTPPVLSNNPPTISNISNRSIYAGGTTGLIPFTVADAETAAGSLTVSVASSNTTLLPSGGLVLAGLGGLRTLAVTPTIGRTGSATVTVTVSDGTQSATDTFVVTVNAVGVGPVILSGPQSATVAPGSALTLSVSATALTSSTYQWYFNDQPIADATASTYTIPVAQRYNAGAYHVAVTSGGVTITSSAATITAGSTASSGDLVNLSTRASALTGDALLIPGFSITGSGNKRVLVRMVGPGLARFGLTGLINDPKLVLKRQTASGYVDVATSLDWADGGSTAMRQAFTLVGAFNLADGSGDAALLLDLAPGMYSVFASDEVQDRTGLSMVEVYDADAAPGSARMGNISTRGYLGTGSSVMITGFVIENGPLTVLLRTVGPGLSRYGVSGVVANPRMELIRRVNDVDEVVAANDDWGSNADAAYTAQVTSQLSAFGLAEGGRDAAIVVTLPAGIYTMISQGAGSTTGVALVEVYAVR